MIWKVTLLRYPVSWMKIVLVLFAAMGVLLDGTSVFAQSVKSLSFQKIIDKSGVIVHGVVSKVESGTDSLTGLICTWTTVEATEWLFGDNGESTLTFKQFGGVDKKRDATQTCENVILYPGEEVLLCLYPQSKWGFTSPIGVHQGIFRALRDPNRSDATLANGSPAAILFPGDEKTPSSPSMQAKTAKRETDSAALLAPCKSLKLNDVKRAVTNYLSKQNRSVQIHGLRTEKIGREIRHAQTASE